MSISASSPPRRPALSLPRRLCYSIAAAALAGGLSCSDGRPATDGGNVNDPALSDRTGTDRTETDVAQDLLADLPADLVRDLAPAGDADGDPVVGDVRTDCAVVYPYECTREDSMADVQPPCPEGEQVTCSFPPECPPGCMIVGIG